MPSRLNTPVLTVDAAKIHQVDPGNVDNLFGMWTVFSRCAESMEQGRRLENLSWRLWNRETFCCEHTTSNFDDKRSRPASSDVPALSESVDSVSSDAERIDNFVRKQPFVSSPAIKRQDSVCSRGNQKHITSMELEKMISNIKDKKDLAPLSPHLTSSVHTIPEIEIQPSLLDAETETEVEPESQPKIQSQHRSNSQNSTDSYATNITFDNVESDHGSHPDMKSDGSETSISSTDLPKSSSVVRGFSPSHVSSYRSSTTLAHNVEPSRPVAPLMRLQKPDPAKKKTGMFTLGGSSGGEDSSFEDRITEERVASYQQQPHRSSLSDGLSKPLPKIKTQPMPEENDLGMIRERFNEDEDAIESDDEDVSESAIEDDDESDWEDSADESGRSTPEDNRHMFQRVDSRPNLVSRRSMLTKLIHEPDRQAALIADASRSGTAMHRSRSRNSQLNGPSVAASPEDEDDNGLTMRGREIPRSKPIIYTTTNTHEAPHSPRTTRRNMLATELTESLRHHLLWERQQKSTTANASKRRHTAHTDMNKLQEYPGPKPAQASREAASKNNSWNHYFDYGPWEYHVKGW